MKNVALKPRSPRSTTRKDAEVRMKRYAGDQWRQDPTNLLVISPTGGGKTYLACAIGIATCQSGHTVAYTRMDDLARRLVNGLSVVRGETDSVS